MISGERIELYGHNVSPFSMRVEMQLRIKGSPIRMQEPPGGLHSEEYRAMTPFDKIPSLWLRDRLIPESDVICRLIEHLYPSPRLLPDDPLEAAYPQILARIADIYIMNAMLPLFELAHDVNEPMTIARALIHHHADTRDDALIARIVPQVLKGISWLEHYVQAGPAAFGNRIAYADCAIVPVLTYVTHFLPRFGQAPPLEAFPKTKTYWSAVQKDELVKGVISDMDEAFAGYGI